MSEEKYILIAGSGTLGYDLVMIDSPSWTAPMDIGQLVIDLRPMAPAPFIRNIDIKIERENKRRDWEQRERKRRRK
jgi:hypothetical protein